MFKFHNSFIAYLNGTEIARRNAPAQTRWNSPATARRGLTAPALLEEGFEGDGSRYTLTELSPATRSRVNQGIVGASGGCLRLINGRIDNQANSIAFPQTVPGLFESVQAHFDYRFKSVQNGATTLAFMLVPVATYGTNGAGVPVETFRDLREPLLPGVFAVGLELHADPMQNVISIYWNGKKTMSSRLAPGGAGLLARTFDHLQIRLNHVKDGATVSVGFVADANGTARRFSPVRNVFVPGLNPFEHRAQIAARISNWDTTIDLDSIKVQQIPAAGLADEEFDVSAHLGALRPGRNVLAIQGLRASVSDEDFLVLPALSSRSSGLQTDAPIYFTSASPGAANSAGLPGLSPTPVFSRHGGTLTNELALELKVRSGKIHYTTDGAEPTESSPTYTEPLKLAGSTLVRARNFAERLVPSPIATESYTMLDESLFDFTSNLPLVILNSHGERITYGERTHGAAAFFDTVKGKSSLTGPLDYAGLGEVNIRGFSSLQYNKHSFTFRLKDESDSKPKVAVLGFPKDSDWILYAPYPDKSLMRDVLAYELSAQMGHYAPRTKFVELFLHSRGDKLLRRDYLGVYVMMEKIKRGKHRVNIEELTRGDNSEPAITGGYIFKRDHSRRQSPNFYTERGGDFFFVEPNEREITRPQAAWLRRYMNQFEQALYGSQFKDPAQGYAAYLDVNSFIDQHWLIEMSKNIDGFRYSVYFTKDRGGKLKLEPVWDWNLSFGNANYYDGWESEGWYTPNLRDNEICWFNRLVQDPEFEQKYIDRWGELRRGIFAPERLLKRVDEMAAQLNEAQQRNFQRWPILGRRIHPNYYVGGSYGAEITWMKQWIQKRVAWIDAQFVAPPILSLKPGAVTPGSKLSFPGAAGKIYYTLDGTDPRAPGAAVSPKATAFDKAVALNGEVKVFARVRSGSKWSSPTTATYRVGAQ